MWNSSFYFQKTIKRSIALSFRIRHRRSNFVTFSDRNEEIREIPRESRGNNEEALLPGGNPCLSLPQVIPVASTVLKGRLFRFGQVCLTGADCSYGNAIPEFPALSFSLSLSLSSFWHRIRGNRRLLDFLVVTTRIADITTPGRSENVSYDDDDDNEFLPDNVFDSAGYAGKQLLQHSERS